MKTIPSLFLLVALGVAACGRDTPASPVLAASPADAHGFALAWASPAAGSTISDTASLTLTGRGLVNVEIFRDGAFVSRCSVSADGSGATCAIDTTVFANGQVTLTAHGWNSPAGTAYTADAVTGPLELVVDNLPPGTVSLAWSSPADGASVSGTTTFELSGHDLVNVELFDNGAFFQRCVVAADGRSASCAIDTTQLPSGDVTLTAHGWNSPAGTAYTSDADAGARTFIVAAASSNDGTVQSDSTGVQAYRIADFMERFGINTFSTIPASGSTPEYNPWGSQGDYSAQGVIDCIDYLTAGSGLTMLVREYHYGDASDPRTVNQQTWCPQVYQATGAQFTVCPGSGGGSSADRAGMFALANSAVSSGVHWLRWLEGDNEPNGNNVSPASAIAAQSSIAQTAHGLGLLAMQMAPIGGLPYAEGYFDGYANSSADTNNAHIYPAIPPDLDDGSNRKGEIGDMLTGVATVFGAKPTVITEWHPTLYAQAHNLDPVYDQYLSPIFMLSAFVNFNAQGYIWFALHDYNADMQSGLFASNVDNPKLAAKTIRAMYQLTGDHGASKHSFTPGRLDVRVSGLPQPINAASPYTGGHFALFENSTGTYFLYLWNEQGAPGGNATPVTVSFDGLHPTSVIDHDLTDTSGSAPAVQSHSNVTTMTVSLAAAVHLLVITP